MFTVDSIKATIAANLGKGRVDVELDKIHVERAITAATKALARHFPMHGYTVMPISIGGQRYKITVPNLLGVLDVSFFNGGARLEEAPYYVRWVDRSIELGDMEDTQKVFGDKPDFHGQFEFDPATETNVYYLYITTTRSSFMDTFARLPTHICVQFAWYIEPTDDKSKGLPRVPYDMQQWVEDYATAKARVILGDIRNKFSGVPGASDDSVMPMDGAQQIARGEEAIAQLEADLLRRRRQAPLIID